MRLGELQDLLAALYVSSAERKAWYRGPETVEHRYGLDETTRKMLRGLENKALEFYADELWKKRFSEITKFIPLTSARYRPSLWEIFGRYAHTHIPAGPKKHIGDTIAFGKFLRSVGDVFPVEALSLLQFELIPWELNFRLQEQPFILRASGVTLHLVQAHRMFGLKCQMKRFKGFIPSIIDRLRNAQALETQRAYTKIDSIGIFLKPPFVSRHLEWYLPWLSAAAPPAA